MSNPQASCGQAKKLEVEDGTAPTRTTSSNPSEGWFSRQIRGLQRFVDRPWYPPLIGLLAALDNLIVVIPNDGILISSSLLAPRKWFIFALCVALGSTLGALVLAALVEFHGLPWILGFFPGLDETRIWTWTANFFNDYGLLVVFFVALSPIVQHPAVILAALADTSLLQLGLVIFGGRFVKFLFMSYAAARAPRLLKRLWGIKGEMKEVGLKID